MDEISSQHKGGSYSSRDGDNWAFTSKKLVQGFCTLRGNRLTDVNGISYSWDANGNLLNDGVSSREL